jgi:hypothetical protein
MQHLECDECRAIFNEIKEAWRAVALEMGRLGLTGDSDLA